MQSRGPCSAPRSGGNPRSESAPRFLALHWGKAKRAPPSGQRPSTWCGTTALQLQALGRGPMAVEASPRGHCITMQDIVPAHPVLCGPPRHCHLAAAQSSLTGGCGPFPEQFCPPSASRAKQSRVSSLLSVRWPKAGPRAQASHLQLAPAPPA